MKTMAGMSQSHRWKNHMEDKIIFKSYLRRLLQDLKDLKEMIKQEDYKKADNMIDNLINDTQSGIEDN